MNSEFAAMGTDSPHALLLPQAQTVGDHCDKLAICGLALDVTYGVAEELRGKCRTQE